VFNDATPIDSPAGRKKHWQLAAQLVHPTNPRAYNSALMELGQTICTTGVPTCLLCPVRQFCKAESPAGLPVKLPKKETLQAEHHDIWLLTDAGLLMEKQADGKRHEGMFRLPQRNKTEVAILPLLHTQKYSVTRYKVTRSLYLADAAHTTPHPGEEYIPLSSLDTIPMASPDRKLIIRFLEKSAD
jgi:A/G-specific adenine glycosylase